VSLTFDQLPKRLCWHALVSHQVSARVLAAAQLSSAHVRYVMITTTYVG
jgi:hypothetical protein